MKKFRNLVASCIGYTYDAVNDRYVNVEKVEKIMEICGQRWSGFNSNNSDLFTDEEERKFAEGYLFENELDEQLIPVHL